MKIIIKDWFQEKMAREMNTKVTCFDIAAISKQSEKAYYATMIYGTLSYGAHLHVKTMWIPKSVTEISDSKIGYVNETLFVETYEEAAEFARHEIYMMT